MFVLLILLALLFGFLTFLLVTPIIIEIDTDSDRLMQLKVRGLCRFCVLFDQGRFVGEFSMLGFRKQFPFKAGKKKEKKPRKSRFTLSKAMNLLRSFRVRQLVWDLDTGDYLLNAHLFGLTWVIARPNINVNVNFNGYNRLRLVVANRLISLGWAYLRK